MVRPLPRLPRPGLSPVPDPSVHILGIRHHGPGSARSVAAALAELQPDLVLIEGAPELDALVPLAGHPELVPPVAGLVYAVESPRRAAFYPLAVFSPEWVALQWAVEHRVEVHFGVPARDPIRRGEDESALRHASYLARAADAVLESFTQCRPISSACRSPRPPT